MITVPKLKPKCSFGLAGDIIATISPHTESSEAALLSQFLCTFGNCINRNVYFVTEADKQRGNIFVLNVGISSKGRKGTSWGYIEKIFSLAEPTWANNCIKSGLSTGEGLIYPLRDSESEQANDPMTKLTRDTRLLCIESEFSSVLKVISRDGNTLSPIVRNAWDGRKLSSLTKVNPISVSDPHISIIGHITKVELMSHLKRDEIWNGFGNRFLYFYVERARLLPEGGSIDENVFKTIAEEISASISFAKELGEIKRDSKARNLWADIYSELSNSRPGMVGVLSSRAEAQVVRLSLLQALINRKNVIDEDCLLSALAIHDYCIDSLNYIFGNLTGNSKADKLLEFIKSQPDGVKKGLIYKHFHNKTEAEEVNQNLEILMSMNLIRVKKVPTGGRDAEIWFAL